MINISAKEIVFLQISTWLGSIGGEHYYGHLCPHSSLNLPDMDVERRLTTQEEADYLNKKKGLEEFNYGKYKIGTKLNEFNSPEQLIQQAKKSLKKIFPFAKVLVRGRSSVAQPQEILIGPKKFKDAVNTLWKRGTAIGEFDDRRCWPEMEQICREWRDIWPKNDI